MTINWQERDRSTDIDRVQEFKVTLVNCSHFTRASFLSHLQYMEDCEKLLHFAETSTRIQVREEERRKNDSTT